MGWLDDQWEKVKKETKKVVKNVSREVTSGAEKLSKGAAIIGQVGYDVSVGAGVKGLDFIDKNIANGNLDLYSGGLLSDAKNAGNILGDLGKGYEVESNLKSGARLGIVAGASIATGGTATTAGIAGLTVSQQTTGLSGQNWGDILATAAKSIPAPSLVKNIINDVLTPSPSTGGVQWYADSEPDLIALDTKGKLIPIIIIGTIVIGGIIVIVKTKKRKNK